MKKFPTKYGHFTSDGNEYVITNYKTPRPWINVISNGTYGLVVSQTGGGFSWETHSEFNRVNRWHQDLIQDNWGKYFYFKNNQTGDIWSPTWMPAKTKLDEYECRHGFGYTKFISVFKRIKVTLNIFIPLKESIEIWNFEIENNSDKELDLSVFTYFEWCLGSSADHHREFHKAFIETDFHSDFNSLTATKRLWDIPLSNRGHWNIEYPSLGFISSNLTISDYDADKESFLGNLGNISNPDAVINDSLAKKTGKWNDSIASIKINLKLKKGERQFASFFIGLGRNITDIKSVLKPYSSQEAIDESLNNVKKYWDEKLNTLVVNTPDEALNFLVNKWLKYQAIVGRIWARTAYYQQSGAYGFRDQLQDSLVFLSIDPRETLKQIRLHARHQKQDGSVLHWWHPITETGLETEMTDDLLWLPYILFHYLDETNDYASLEVKEPYYDNSELEDSLFIHCKASIDKVLERMSERGLPLIGAGDWNDGLSAVGLEMKGESIWLAEFLYLILTKFSSLCDFTNKDDLTQYYSKKAKQLKTAFDNHAWDGEWFYRATKDTGEKIGSKDCEEGKIFLNAQTWSVISNIADAELQCSAMTAVTKHLLKDNGALLFHPAYTKPDDHIGYLSRYAPGRRENGGVYTHAATWAIWAYSILKDYNNAYKTFKNLCPIYNAGDPDKYKAEPYVTPGNIEGPDSPFYGMGGWTWYTGSAAWFQKLIVECILGIKATREGLLIEPCIPNDWENYTVQRSFRSTIYNINVVNKSLGRGQIKSIEIDGEVTEGNLIPKSNKSSVNVDVYLG